MPSNWLPVNFRLEFTSTEAAVGQNEVIFICVGTPPLENGEADLSAVESVAQTIAGRARGYRLVVEKSTVPVQTGRQLKKHLGWYSTNGLRCEVAYNPEFLREGSAVGDFFHPDRIVAGVESLRAESLLREVYGKVLNESFVCPIHQPGCGGGAKTPFVVTDINSAEMIKQASNSFLVMKVSFINMVADLCEAAEADVHKVAVGIGLDWRIGSSFLRPGIAFGGFCFPKDLKAFVRIAQKFGCDFSLLEQVERINARRIDRFVDQIKKELWVLRDKTVAAWGLTFKPGTDDVRSSSTLGVLRRLLAENACVQAYDPQGTVKAKKVLPGVTYCEDPCEAARSADAIMILTEWEVFAQVDWERLRRLVDRPLIIDGRNMRSREVVTSHGFQYAGVGMASLAPAEELIAAPV